MRYALNPRNYTNYIMQKKNLNKNIGNFLKTNQLLKILNYKYIMTILFFSKKIK